MSSGDIAGGMSPARVCILGDGFAEREERKLVRDSEEPLGFDERSINVGRLIVTRNVSGSSWRGSGERHADELKNESSSPSVLITQSSRRNRMRLDQCEESQHRLRRRGEAP